MIGTIRVIDCYITYLMCCAVPRKARFELGSVNADILCHHYYDVKRKVLALRHSSYDERLKYISPISQRGNMELKYPERGHCHVSQPDSLPIKVK